MTSPIGGIGPGRLQGPDSRGIPMGPEPTGGKSFAETMADALSDVSNTQDEARTTIESMIRGDRELNVHEIMALSEEASLSLELLVEMRNKLTEAYRSIMNMQT